MQPTLLKGSAKRRQYKINSFIFIEVSQMRELLSNIQKKRSLDIRMREERQPLSEKGFNRHNFPDDVMTPSCHWAKYLVRQS